MHSFAVTFKFLINFFCVCILSTLWILKTLLCLNLNFIYLSYFFSDTSTREFRCLQFWYPHSVFLLIQLVKSSIFLLEKPIQEFCSLTRCWYILHAFISFPLSMSWQLSSPVRRLFHLLSSYWNLGESDNK